jgi:hypothetical protein
MNTIGDVEVDRDHRGVQVVGEVEDMKNLGQQPVPLPGPGQTRLPQP